MQLQTSPTVSRPFCRTVGYTASTKRCTLYGQTPGELGFAARASSPTVFYNYACFDCLSTCPPPAGNLLVNPNFDMPTTSNRSINGFAPSASPLGPWNMAEDGYFGSDSLSVVQEGSGSPDSLRIYPSGTVGQAFHGCLRQLYEISFDWKVGSISTQSASFHITTGGGDLYRKNTPLYLEDIDRWWHFVDSFVLDEGDQQRPNAPLANDFRLYFDGDSYNDAKFDNLVIRPVSASAYTPAVGSKNLLINGGFESGRLGAWKSDTGAVQVRSPGLNSKYAIGSSPNNRYGELYQAFKPEKGRQYVLRFRYKQNGDCQGYTMFIFISQEPRATAGYEAMTRYETQWETANQWSTFQRPLTATGTNMMLGFRFSVPDACDPLIDDVSIQPMA